MSASTHCKLGRLERERQSKLDQKCGIGGSLIRTALERLKTGGAAGCMVLGEPRYYGRFGFQHDPAVSFSNVPPPYFQVLPLGSSRIKGVVEYHAAFG